MAAAIIADGTYPVTSRVVGVACNTLAAILLRVIERRASVAHCTKPLVLAGTRTPHTIITGDGFRMIRTITRIGALLETIGISIVARSTGSTI